MKKLICTGFFLVIAGYVTSQQKFSTPLNSISPEAISTQNSAMSQMPGLINIYMDYDYAEQLTWFGATGGGYSNFIWPMNMRYNGLDSAWKYGTIVYDSLYDYPSATGYNSNTVSSVIVDSILVRFGHENASATMDTIIAKLLSVDNNGYPTSTVLWEDTIFSNVGLSLANNWLFTTSRKFYPGIAVANNKFAVKMEYYGSKLDTFGIIAGYGYLTGLCAGNPNYFFTQRTAFSKINALPNPFIANSFSFWTQPNLNLQYPGINGQNVQFNCATLNYMQNFTIGAYVTLDQSLAVHASDPVIICQDKTTTLTAIGLGGIQPITYQWSPAAGLSCATCPVTTATPASTTTYTVTASDINGPVTDTVTIIVDLNIVQANFTYTANNLLVNYTNASLNATNYLWNFGANATPPTATGNGPYMVSYSTSGTKSVKLRATNISDFCTDSLLIDIELTNIGIEETETKSGTQLFQNSPNPFSKSSEIIYVLKENSMVEFTITDIAGSIVKSWNLQEQSPGAHTLVVDAASLAPGIYFYTMKSEGDLLTRKFAVSE